MPKDIKLRDFVRDTSNLHTAARVFAAAAAQRRPVPNPECHGISPTCKRGETPRVVQ
jgi:hypothetical protein